MILHYRFSVIVVAVALCTRVGHLHAVEAELRDRTTTDPFSTGRFSWIVSQPLIGPVSHGEDTCYSIKDPSIVWYEGRWHLFSTIRSKNHTHQIEYTSFVDWKDANHTQRHLLNLTGEYNCAPQVFYFSPQKKWYLIYQVQDPTRKPSIQPAFSTSSDISDPTSWSRPKLLFDQHPDNVKMWIDYWVICDEEKAHLFFTSHKGWMWRSETSLGSFPAGWSEPRIALQGDIFEASHTYRLKDTNRFLTLVEAQDAGRRYFKAFTAERLDGKWSPLAASREKPLVSTRNVRFDGPSWTNSFSHGEFLRSGYDENLEIDPNEARLLFQGVASEARVDENYGKIPWKLGLLTLDSIHESSNLPSEFPYRHWTVEKPLFKAGSVGSFDEVSVKDPSIVYHAGKWHLFYTSKPHPKNKQFADGVGYVAAKTMEGLNQAKRFNISAIVDEAVVAPQIFYFSPHKLWYLIAQRPYDGPCELEPVYLTNRNLDDVDSWSKPKAIKTNRKVKSAFWIDFWVICDERKAHLFYTDHAGSMFRLETPVDRFPQGFSESSEQVAVNLRGVDKRGPWRLHEASHIYYVKDEQKYLALLEAVRPHPTKPNYWDSRNRFMLAMTADSLEGPWKRVEKHANDFIGIPDYLFNQDGSKTVYDQVSHPELIRSGFDEKLEVQDYRLQVLFQAFDASNVPDTYDYNNLPWELSLMKNY